MEEDAELSFIDERRAAAPGSSRVMSNRFTLLSYSHVDSAEVFTGLPPLPHNRRRSLYIPIHVIFTF
jgi:hypothetical protein